MNPESIYCIEHNINYERKCHQCELAKITDGKIITYASRSRLPQYAIEGSNGYLYGWFDTETAEQILAELAVIRLNKNNILPCPFCGAEVEMCPNNSYGDCIIGCNCDHEPAVIEQIGKEDYLISKWNRRA